MNDVSIDTTSRWQQVDNLPIGLFGSVMGLTGLSIAWRLAHGVFGAPCWAANAWAVAAIAAFVAVGIGYGIKIVTAPKAVSAEFHHPFSGNLFGMVFISLLLLPIVLAPVSLLLARTLWILGAFGMSVFAWLIVSRWMSGEQQVAHVTPAWIVPGVGLLDMPLAVPALGFDSSYMLPLHQLMVAALSIGLFLAVPLFTIIFSRILFQPPMPDALQSTLLILVAPFAIGYSAYTIVSGTIDLFAQALYMLTLFMLAVLLGRVRKLGQCCPFRFAWWSVSFPLAASAIASLRYAAYAPGWIANALAIATLALATITIMGLLVRTLFGLARGELRTLSS